MAIEIYTTPPKEFKIEIAVAACYIEVDGKLLLLQLGPEKKEHGCWGLPAGKMKELETPYEAAARELFEETGIILDDSIEVRSCGALFIRRPKIEYVLHTFKPGFKKMPEIVLSDEHQDYRWTTPCEREKMALLEGGKEVLLHHFLAL